MLSPDKPNELYLGTAEGDFIKRFCNQRKPVNSEGSANKTALFKIYVRTKRNIKLKPGSNVVHCQKGTALFQYIQEVSAVSL